jgi:peptidoglycan/LPS O-acetylase OafA/YrhL
VSGILALASLAVGYALSLLSQLPRRGRAFECVYFFTTVIGGMLLAKWGLDQWDEQQHLIGKGIAVLAGLFGLIVAYIGFLSSFAKLEQKRASDTVSVRH